LEDTATSTQYALWQRKQDKFDNFYLILSNIKTAFLPDGNEKADL
jgi:hypothetical protein